MRFLLIILVLMGFHFNLAAKDNNFFDEAKKLFKEEKFEKSKFLFQRNIVYNPKDANSYLYLAKIFKTEDDEFSVEKNLNTALLLDSKNEEAMYLLIDIEISRSNFSKAEELKNDFKKICTSLCEKISSIDTRLKEFKKKDAS